MNQKEDQQDQSQSLKYQKIGQLQKMPVSQQKKGSTNLQTKVVKHVRFEKSSNNSEIDDKESIQKKDDDHQQSNGQKHQQNTNSKIELQNNPNIDKYNSFRYDQPTYLTVQTFSQIEMEKMSSKQQRDLMKQNRILKCPLKSETKESGNLIKNARSPQRSSSSKNQKQLSKGLSVFPNRSTKQYQTDRNQQSLNLSNTQQQSSAQYSQFHSYSKNVNISTTKVVSAQSNSSKKQNANNEGSYQNIHSFEGSSFDNRVQNKDKQNLRQSAMKTNDQFSVQNQSLAKQQASKYDEIMQSIDESQLGFVNNQSDEIQRTHSESSGHEKVLTPSQLLDYHPVILKNEVLPKEKKQIVPNKSPVKSFSPKNIKDFSQKEMIEDNNEIKNNLDEDDDQSFDEKQFYLKFKTSVLQDHARNGPGGTNASRNVTLQNLSGPQSGLQSAAISQNQTPETSNNIPIHLLNQSKQNYGNFGEPIDQASIYLANQTDMQNLYSQNQHSINPGHQPIDSQQMTLIEENTFDFLSSYQSDKDEDYSEKEDLIMNKKFYAKDLTKPFEKNISKAEVQCLLKDQIPIISDSFRQEIDESSLMAVPYNIRDKEKLLGKRNFQESSMQQQMNLNMKDSAMNSYQQFDNGYTEYLMQSQNIQNSLLNNFQGNIADNSVEPIITRNRGKQQIQTRNGQYHSPNKPTPVQRSEKSFSFCNSLRENSMNHERAAERSRQIIERNRRAGEGSSYRESRPQRRIVETNTQVNGPSYQNNYYYNFNNNYNGVLPPNIDQDRFESAHAQRQIETKCVEVQVSPTMIDGAEKPQIDQFQNMIQQQIPQFCEHFATKRKRGRKAKIKQSLKASQTEQQEVFNNLTTQISRIYGAGTKTLSKDELAQIGQYQVMLMQFLHKQTNVEDKVTQPLENGQPPKLPIQNNYSYPAQYQRQFQHPQQTAPLPLGHSKMNPSFQGNPYMQPSHPSSGCIPQGQLYPGHSTGYQHQPLQNPNQFHQEQHRLENISPISEQITASMAPPEEKINFFFNEQLIEIIRQLDMYVQLLYQVLIIMKSKPDSKKKGSKKAGEKFLRSADEEIHQFSESDNEMSEDDFFFAREKPTRQTGQNPETKDRLKYQVYNLLYDVIKRREDAINQFKLDHNITSQSPIPKYEVPWVTYWMKRSESLLKGPQRPPDQLVFRVMPQISYFQVPLLEFAPQVIDAFLYPFPKKEHNNPINIFLQMRPLLNQNLLPIDSAKNAKKHKSWKPPLSAKTVLDEFDDTSEDSQIENECIDPFDCFFDPVFMSEKEYSMFGSLDFKKKYQVFDYQNTCQQDIVFPYASNTRRKFSIVDDNFLLMAITSLGTPKDFESINMHWLVHKAESEIKHRLKNLTCQRAPDNIIKRWKMQYSMPLRQGWMTREGALGTKVMKPSSIHAVPDDLVSIKSKDKAQDKNNSDQDSNQEDDSSHGSADESENEGKGSTRHQFVQKRTRNNKLYYYNEMHSLALGVKWFGTRSISQEILKNLLDKFLSVDKKAIGDDIDPLYLQHHNIEKLIHMSQLSRWNQISRYFLPSRSGEFLKQEYSNILTNPDRCKKFTQIMLDAPDFKTYEEIVHSKILKQQTQAHNFAPKNKKQELMQQNGIRWGSFVEEIQEIKQPNYKFKPLYNIIEKKKSDEEPSDPSV